MANDEEEEWTRIWKRRKRRRRRKLRRCKERRRTAKVFKKNLRGFTIPRRLFRGLRNEKGQKMEKTSRKMETEEKG